MTFEDKDPTVMYKQFGFGEIPDGGMGFRLFVPDNTIDPNQYNGGGPCKITSVKVVGDFQTTINPENKNWDQATGLLMDDLGDPHGHLWTVTLPSNFPDGYFQYKFIVSFRNGSVRWVGDPCGKHGGNSNDNAAFVKGGSPLTVTPLNPAFRRPKPRDIIAYELMIDDFTKDYRGDRAPIDAVVDKLQHIKELGVNAIEFMPWIAWPDSDSFSWGYDPINYFAVENDLVTGPGEPLDKLSRLGNLISKCHEEGLMVILDIVLQHASHGLDTGGFPYYWLWQDAADCPFVGSFTNASTFGSLPLDYHNTCTLEFMRDVCVYWIEQFKVDGFRFDQVSGYHNPDFPHQGAPALMSSLREYLDRNKLYDFPLIIEDQWDFGVMADTNEIGATSGWFDMFRACPFNALAFNNHLGTDYVRVLNTSRDFNFPIGPTIYIDNHDHASIALRAGGRGQWFRTQPYAIALATCSGNLLLRNGQEFAQEVNMPENGQEPPDRVQSRPLKWELATDDTGRSLRGIYKLLLDMRRQHPSLGSPNFYPNDYDQQWVHFSSEGYGIDVDKQVVIYHRWGNDVDGVLERFIVVLNFSDTHQFVNVPFPADGVWTDLINNNTLQDVNGFRLFNFGVPDNWGCVFFRKG